MSPHIELIRPWRYHIQRVAVRCSVLSRRLRLSSHSEEMVSKLLLILSTQLIYFLFPCLNTGKNKGKTKSKVIHFVSLEYKHPKIRGCLGSVVKLNRLFNKNKFVILTVGDYRKRPQIICSSFHHEAECISPPLESELGLVILANGTLANRRKGLKISD